MLREISMEFELDNRWKNIWELMVLRVVKLFMWKAGNDLLLTRKNSFCNVLPTGG